MLAPDMAPYISLSMLYKKRSAYLLVCCPFFSPGHKSLLLEHERCVSGALEVDRCAERSSPSVDCCYSIRKKSAARTLTLRKRCA